MWSIRADRREIPLRSGHARVALFSRVIEALGRGELFELPEYREP